MRVAPHEETAAPPAAAAARADVSVRHEESVSCLEGTGAFARQAGRRLKRFTLSCGGAGHAPPLAAETTALLERHRQRLRKALKALRAARPGTVVRADSGRLPSYAALVAALLDTKARGAGDVV